MKLKQIIPKSIITKVSFTLVLILIIYSKLARFFSIDFFWESSHISIISFFILLLILVRNNHKKVLSYLIRIVSILSLFVITIVNLAIFNSSAYKTAINSIQENNYTIKKVGDIKSFGYLLSGNIANGAQYSSSKFKIIVKGNKGHCELLIELEKNGDQDWRVVDHNILY